MTLRVMPIVLILVAVACSSPTASAADAEGTPPDSYVNSWSYHDGQGNDFVIYRNETWRCELHDPDAPATGFDFDWDCTKDPSGPTPIPGTWPGCEALPECSD